MKTIPFRHEGRTYHLLMNAAALFDVYETFGSNGFVLDHIQGNNRTSLKAICWMLAKLAEQGELWRRYQGFEGGQIPTEEQLLMGLSPMEVPEARRAIIQAVQEGFHQEAGPERNEVDVGLLELQKKTEAP